ncbi:hypothetical protein JCM10213_007875 [Rhodosporidiobolus nylandii]
MLARSVLTTRAAIRPSLAPAARSLHSTPLRSTTHPTASPSGQSVGEDSADTQRKNAAVPLVMAGGAGFVGYILYTNFYSGKEAREAEKEAPHSQAKSKPPAGSKENTGLRG